MTRCDKCEIRGVFWVVILRYMYDAFLGTYICCMGEINIKIREI